MGQIDWIDVSGWDRNGEVGPSDTRIIARVSNAFGVPPGGGRHVHAVRNPATSGAPSPWAMRLDKPDFAPVTTRGARISAALRATGENSRAILFLALQGDSITADAYYIALDNTGQLRLLSGPLDGSTETELASAKVPLADGWAHLQFTHVKNQVVGSPMNGDAVLVVETHDLTRPGATVQSPLWTVAIEDGRHVRGRGGICRIRRQMRTRRRHDPGRPRAGRPEHGVTTSVRLAKSRRPHPRPERSVGQHIDFSRPPEEESTRVTPDTAPKPTTTANSKEMEIVAIEDVTPGRQEPTARSPEAYFGSSAATTLLLLLTKKTTPPPPAEDDDEDDGP
ncbi:MAG: hypothetical protein AAGA56_11655 [Myxococcota bacterium]